MKRVHRILLTSGIITTSLLSIVIEAAVHYAVLVGLLTNLAWLWDDVIDGEVSSKKERKVSDESQGSQA